MKCGNLECNKDAVAEGRIDNLGGSFCKEHSHKLLDTWLDSGVRNQVRFLRLRISK